MSNRLRYFSTESEYNDASASFEYPTIAYIQESDYINWMVRDYSKEFLTFQALENCVFTMTLVDAGRNSSDSHNPYRGIGQVSYSLDDGSTWTDITDIPTTGTKVITTPTVAAGHKVLWKGDGRCFNTSGIQSNVISSTGRYIAYGNIFSLLYLDEFEGMTEAADTWGYCQQNYHNCFANFFANNANLIDVENLILPLETITSEYHYCFYAGMFKNCTSIKKLLYYQLNQHQTVPIVIIICSLDVHHYVILRHYS